ncbi:hypothetical protein SAMN05216303_102209 [Rhodoferax sp. OV413]|uniref:hypothetical protein n=1 Tax=Rhodoferax sp. OV413 TaxID=1855285 RepID=UPI0008802125|nr:hypothetical protein [Rhodoferax sp. OV413]SDO73126.1 hypothetical protein SAMN05216303_102209 [Rhodoferax sp. OV413]
MPLTNRLPRLCTSLAACAATAAQAQPITWTPPANWLLYCVPVVALVGAVIAIWIIRSALLQAPNWSLADALSEPTDLPVYTETTDAAGNVTRSLQLGADGRPLLAPQMRASSSRVIALMGMVAILFLFIGFGALALFGLGSTGQVPEHMDRVVNFLVAGMTLFAPYVVNKFSALFQGLTGRK